MFFIQVYSVLPGGDGGCDGRLPDLPWEGGRKNMVRLFVQILMRWWNNGITKLTLTITPLPPYVAFFAMGNLNEHNEFATKKIVSRNGNNDTGGRLGRWGGSYLRRWEWPGHDDEDVHGDGEDGDGNADDKPRTIVFIFTQPKIIVSIFTQSRIIVSIFTQPRWWFFRFSVDEYSTLQRLTQKDRSSDYQMMKWFTCDVDNKYENIKGEDDEGDIRKSCVFYTPENEVTYMMKFTPWS